MPTANRTKQKLSSQTYIRTKTVSQYLEGIGPIDCQAKIDTVQWQIIEVGFTLGLFHESTTNEQGVALFAGDSLHM